MSKSSLGLAVLCLSIGFLRSASGTIYIAAYDPETKATGLAYSSSGGNFWQARVKTLGLLGAQARGLCQEAKPEELIKAGLSAPLIAEKIRERCDAVGWESYRLAIVTSDGKIASVIAAKGCTPENQFCGEIYGKDFLIIGGGLEAGVLEAGLNAYARTDAKTPLACRLFQTLTAVYAAGGEKKEFRGASLTVDDPSATTLFHTEARGNEQTFLPTLLSQLKNGGLACDTLP